MNHEIINKLQEKVTAKILLGDDIPEEYCHDEMNTLTHKPDAVIKVQSTTEVSEVVKIANQYKIPFLARGSGTGLVGGSVPVNGGIVIDMSPMNKIIELDCDNLTITVEAGVLLMQLSEFVEANGYFYPPDPGEKTATIGGNIATNAGGMRAVKYGVTNNYVKALTVVLPSGEILHVGSKTVKNSSGYNLLGLICGSEGTLCIITEATLKLLTYPKHSISLLVPYNDMQTALTVVNKILKSETVPVALEYMTQQTLVYTEKFLNKKFPSTNYPAYLLLSFDANTQQTLEHDYKNVADLCLSNGAQDVLIVNNEARKKVVWSARGAFLESIKYSTTKMDECDVVVPRNKMADFIMYTEKLQKEIDIRIVCFGHAGDGNLHIYICKDQLPDEEFETKLNCVFGKLYNEASRVGGLVSGEHGIGYAKKQYLCKQCGSKVIELMQQIKKVFDPNNLLNANKVI